MASREISPVPQKSPRELLHSPPTSCPLQSGEACCTMPLTAARRTSVKNTPHSHQHNFIDTVNHDHSDYPGYDSETIDITSQCTDECIVITCDGPGHGDAHCVDPADCDLVCQNSEKCHDCDDFEEFLQCCSDFHPYLAEPKSFDTTYAWTPISSADSGQPAIFNQTGQRDSSFPLGVFSETNHVQASTVNMLGNKLSDYSYDFSQQYPPSIPSGPHSAARSPSIQSQTSAFSPAEISPPLSTGSLVLQNSTIMPEATHVCMWGNCSAQFSSADALTAHVNTNHLQLTFRSQGSTHPLHHPSAPHSHPHPLCQPDEGGHDHHKKFSCLWRDCHEFFPELVDAPSLDNPHAPYDPFTAHILSHHLGYPGPNLPPLPKYPDDYPKEYLEMYANKFSGTSDNMTIDHHPSSSDLSRSEHEHAATASSSSRSVTPLLEQGSGQQHQHQCKEKHVCHWKECGEVFDSCDELMLHLTAKHVGGGKPHYDCYWGECGRNGQSGFTSKQKIRRHLQSHTGHRPFQCKLCHQNFSEAATLQQHIRRHTREKPYMCDHPGCGKSFAITGALTIHKRTHNGHKPFKCTFCDRAFAESSNLSKHLRTHTGDRPYVCLEPECNKTFARPDQLNRHSKVHQKKSAKVAATL
ncbi:hypothetical protein D9757_004754 [Collybiopsis confluens]|uniref:C2H2-type domain-containing protein n=1 Tax=Collybiopsis confluens TaxID=2823264 RepID=A0A8H5HSA8_9AGAR|nr:hypothetical protein D9757_004754 [Collybiopsis confluens]